jgi:ketosteroid isomerase-like protein
MSFRALALGVLLYVPTLFAQAPATDAEIRRLEQLEVRAVLAKDTATLRTLWDKDLVVNNPDNLVVMAKANPVDRPVMQKARIAFTRTVEKVTFRGEFAISMGSETLVPGGDQPRAGQTVVRRFTNIWMRQPEGWKLVARHANVICR